MTRKRGILSAAVLGLGFVVGGRPAVLGDEPPPQRAELETTLSKLEQDIARVRGLKFKTPVVTKVIPRPKDRARDAQGYYSIKDKVFFVYDDVGIGYRREALVQGMLRALQDQNFDLAKLGQSSFGSDADEALYALIFGDAAFTRIELLKEDDPKIATLLDAPWENMPDIRAGFVHIQGARYVRALKNRGGWDAVNAAYSNPPRSTAAVLHPEGAQIIDLGPGTTRGELAILQMLAIDPMTAARAVQVTAGWRGDRVVEYGAVKSWVIAFVNKCNALEFQAALSKLRVVQNPRLKTFLDDPGATAWHEEKGAVAAVLARGDRVFVVEAPDDVAYKALLDQLTGPPSLVAFAAKDKSFISFGQMVDRLLDADLICIGATHESDLHHRAEFEIIKAVFARDERLGVGMEMFQRPDQWTIDRFLHGELTEGQFLKTVEQSQRLGLHWSLNRSVVEFCRLNSVPLAALSAPPGLRERVSKAGLAGLMGEEKDLLGDIDLFVQEHRDYWLDHVAKNDAGASSEHKELFYQVITVGDEYMAASAARFQQEHGLRRLIVLAGSDHIDRGFGIPARTVKRTGGKVVTIGFGVDGDSETTFAEPRTDYTLYVSGTVRTR
jgi:uncharacterized iron-regulated protein